MLCEAIRRVWPGTPSSSRCTRKNSGERGLTGSSRSGRRRGISGAPWYRSSTARRSCNRSMFLCRRWNQLVEVCRKLDTHIPEHAIEVPKISFSSRHSRRRRVRFAEQTAELLVEVPTIVSFSSLHGLVEQNVDFPVPRGRVGGGGLFGLHPGQSSTAFGEAEHCFPTATAEQIVDIPVPRGGRQDPDLPSAASSSGLPGMTNQGVFFALFPVEKKSARLGPHSGSELGVRTSAHPRRQLMLEGSFTDAAGGVWMQFPDGRWKLLGSDPEVWWPG